MKYIPKSKTTQTVIRAKKNNGKIVINLGGVKVGTK